MHGKAGKTPHLSKLKFRVGQHVRISEQEMKFSKGGEQNYTTEIFKVRKVVHRTPVPCSNSRTCKAERSKALPEAVTCLLYLEYDNSVFIDLARNVTTDFS
jgi:hypothetical protein